MPQLVPIMPELQVAGGFTRETCRCSTIAPSSSKSRLGCGEPPAGNVTVLQSTRPLGVPDSEVAAASATRMIMITQRADPQLAALGLRLAQCDPSQGQPTGPGGSLVSLRPGGQN